MRIILTVLVLLVSACTYNTYYESDDTMKDKGILGTQSKPNIGDSTVIDPGMSPVAGTFTFVKDFKVLPSVSALDKLGDWDPENISIAIQANQLDVSQVGTLQNISLQAILKWQVAKAAFGAVSEAPAMAVQFRPFFVEVPVDIQFGTTLTLPAAAAMSQLMIRYTARTNQNNGFSAGTQLPKFRINAGYSYGNVTGGPLTMTQVIENAINSPANPFTIPNGVPGTSIPVIKPPFAESVLFTWIDYNAVGGLQVSFVAQGGNFIWGPIIIPKATLPPPRLPWPNEAVAAFIENKDAGVAMTYVRAVSYLNL